MSQLTSRRQMMVQLFAPVALISLAGCAAGAGVPSEYERRELAQRVKDYWAHMQANDRLKAWKYEMASQDQSLTLESYLKRGGLIYDAVEVRGIGRIEAGEAEIDVWMRYSVPLMRLKGQEVVTRDRWRKSDGEWFHVLPHNPLFNVAK